MKKLILLCTVIAVGQLYALPQELQQLINSVANNSGNNFNTTLATLQALSSDSRELSPMTEARRQLQAIVRNRDDRPSFVEFVNVLAKKFPKKELEIARKFGRENDIQQINDRPNFQAFPLEVTNVIVHNAIASSSNFNQAVNAVVNVALAYGIRYNDNTIGQLEVVLNQKFPPTSNIERNTNHLALLIALKEAGIYGKNKP